MNGCESVGAYVYDAKVRASFSFFCLSVKAKKGASDI